MDHQLDQFENQCVASRDGMDLKESMHCHKISPYIDIYMQYYVHVKILIELLCCFNQF